MPFGSTLAGTPPGVKVTSLTGLPEISTSRPPTWNEPMSRSAIGSAALASVVPIRMAAVQASAIRDMFPPIVVISLSPVLSRGRDKRSSLLEGRGEGLSPRLCSLREPLTRIASQSDLSPRRAGRGNSLIPRIPRRFPSRHPAEHAANRHADAGRVALAEHVAGHDFAGREHVGGGLAVLHHHARLPVHAGAEIGKGDAGPHRVGQIGRRLDLARPMRLLRRDAFGAAIVENGMIERAGPHRGI